MRKAAVFDLDGTLLYTLDSIARAGNRMLEALGFPPRPLDEYRYYCGDGVENLVRRVLRVQGGLTPENVKEGCRINRAFLAEDPLYNVKPYEGIEDALLRLRAGGIRLAVFSNKPDAQTKEVIETFFPGVFDCVRGQVEGFPVKPDPAGVMIVARELGVSPSEFMYFGDSGTDMKTGKGAGMYTVGVLWGYRTREELEENGADRIIKRPDEMAGVTEGWTVFRRASKGPSLCYTGKTLIHIPPFIS
ncbi:MAG: HAD family hydrolase, partial [Lachnospiraceae bacterium]|nr:HAD family hydrolase [Lachnospiraceae bacterium]